MAARLLPMPNIGERIVNLQGARLHIPQNGELIIENQDGDCGADSGGKDEVPLSIRDPRRQALGPNTSNLRLKTRVPIIPSIRSLRTHQQASMGQAEDHLSNRRRPNPLKQ